MNEIVARNENIKLFLEGIEIPASSIHLNIGVGRPSICSATIPTSNELIDISFEPPNFRGLQPGTIMQVFYQDKDDWKLLFDGTVQVIGSQESFMSKVTQISAVDMSEFWASIPQYFLDKSKSGYPPGDYLLGRENANSIKVRGESVKIESKFVSLFRKHGLYKGMQKILELIPNINPYYKGVEDRLKLSKRFKVIENFYASQLFAKSKLWKDLGNRLALLGGKKSILDVLNTTMAVVRYLFVPNPSYSLIDDTVNNMLFVPNLFIKVPPRCNTIFPEDYNSIRPSAIDFRSIPTRVTSILQNPYSTSSKPAVKIFVEPEEHSKELARGNYTYFSDEEFYRGPVRSNKIIYSNLYAQSGTKSDAYSKQATKFDYYMQRYAASQIEVSCGSIIPDLVVGFPILVLVYPKNHLLGRLVSHTISIDTNGQLVSQLGIDCVRHYNAPEPPSFDKWFQPDLFSNEYIGRGVYLDTLGFSKQDKDGSIMLLTKNNRNDYKSAIENLCNGKDGIYDVTPNKEAFRRWWRDRHIATLYQSMRFVGAAPMNLEANLSTNDIINRYNTCSMFGEAGDYRAWFPDYVADTPTSKKIPYVSQRQQQIILYLKSLSFVV